MARPTINDLATAAGVSLATVDRVLNARQGVRQVTVERVNEAIEKIGFVRDPFATNLARRRDFRVVTFVPFGDGQFLSELRSAVQNTARAASAERVDLQLRDFERDDPHALARALDLVCADEVDGVAMMARETPPLRDAVRRLKARGVPTATIISDLPNSQREYFIGINNIAAGRTAGSLMGKFLGGGSGKVAVVASSLQDRDNLDRRLGFDQVVAENHSSLAVLPTLEGHDDAAVLSAGLQRLLQANPDVQGIYSVGGGNRVVLQVLHDCGLSGRLRVIMHELTRTTRDGLRFDQVDAVITQDLGHILRSAIRKLRATRDQRPVLAEQERIRIEILVKENLE